MIVSICAECTLLRLWVEKMRYNSASIWYQVFIHNKQFNRVLHIIQHVDIWSPLHADNQHQITLSKKTKENETTQTIIIIILITIIIWRKCK